MKKSIFFVVLATLALPCLLSAQQTLVPGRFLPKATPKGIGKIDTRVDNLGYWRRMADSGFVYVERMESVPSAIYTGSQIRSTMVIPANSPDVLTTTQTSTQSENSIFVNPGNNLAMVNSNNSTTNPVTSLYGADYLLSTDGGATWGGSISGAGGSNSGDPTTAISLTGRQYVGFINNNNGQSVAWSADNGSTWTAVVTGNAPPGNGNLLDKNHMWIDNTSSSPYAGYVYDAWTCFGGNNANDQIQITRSVNGGLNWSAPAAISAGVNAGSLNHGVNICTGPGGQVYVIWAIYDSWPSDEISIGFTKSTNGGSSYATASRIISNIRGIRNSGTAKNQRVNSFPSMAVDISGGPNNGNIYVVWTNIGVPGINSGTDIDVYMIRSTDQGSTWSSPIRVNQDPIGLGKEHYFPWITCDRATGELSVVFYDDRNVSSTQCETWVAYSCSAGDLWKDFKVSDVAFTPTPIPGLATGYMGDYLGISSNDARVYPTWTDNRTGTAMTYVSPYNLQLAPAVYFKANMNLPCINQTVLFQDMTLKNPTSWLWTITPSGFTFVNGTSSASQNPQVQFTSAGNYNVRLIASNTFGADTLLRSGYITVYNGNADFSASLTHINAGNSTIFNEISPCGITSYSWSFGSGATPSTATTSGPVTVTYSTAGFKDVSLTVNGNATVIRNNYIMVDGAYCTASTTTCDEYISNVTVGNINNTSGCTPGGYQSYTEHWTRVSPSVGYPVTVTNGLAYSGDQCGIWVDWNQNLSFTDAGETMTVTKIGGGTSFTATLTPPPGAPKGLTRMRARITYTGSVPACGNTTYGEAEDYSIYVGTPGLWAGGTAGSETNWNTANNWDDGIVPASTTNVIIPAGLAYYPIVSGTFSCLNMQVKDGGTLTVQAGATLNVTGTLDVGQGVSGVMVVDGGTCNVTGTVTAHPGSIIDVRNGGSMTDY